MTFDDFVIELTDRTPDDDPKYQLIDLWLDLRDDVRQWRIDDAYEPGDEPMLYSPERLLEWNIEEKGDLHWDVELRWFFGRYILIDQMVTAGLDFDLAVDWAFDGWRRRCGCSWNQNRGPLMLDEDWRAIGMEPDDLLCRDCVSRQIEDAGMSVSEVLERELKQAWEQRRKEDEAWDRGRAAREATRLVAGARTA
jgi:hypothetical protein